MSSNNNNSNIHLGIKLIISVSVLCSSLELNPFWGHGLPIARVWDSWSFMR